MGTFLLTLLLLFGVWQTAGAAMLYMDPPALSVKRGDTVKVSVRLDTDEDECVNTIDGVITYDDALNLVDVSRGQSILSMWVEEPKIDSDNNTLTFAGGIPNGYCGRIAGDPRLTNVVLDLIFQIPGFVIGASDVATATISFDEKTQVLRNDGLGTVAPLRMLGAQVVIAKNTGGKVVNQWRDIIEADTLPPEEFSISLQRSENAFNNKYFIVFNTTDKQSGIAYYEVMEEPLEEGRLFNWGRADAPWIPAQSPYVLKDQSLNSTIRVRAIDKAGNEYVATLVPDESQRGLPNDSKILIALLAAVLTGVLVFAGVYVYITRRRRIDTNSAYETDSTART